MRFPADLSQGLFSANSDFPIEDINPRSLGSDLKSQNYVWVHECVPYLPGYTVTLLTQNDTSLQTGVTRLNRVMNASRI